MTRLLAVDVDGTLVKGTGTIEPGLAEAIAKLRARGWVVVLASGRRLHMMAELVRAVPVDGLIASDGATVTWRGTSERLARLPYRACLAVARDARRWRLSPMICTEQETYVERFNADVAYAMSFGGVPPRVRPFSRVAIGDVALLVLVTATARPLMPAARQLARRHRVDVAPSTRGFLSVAPRGVNKGRALDYLVARHLGGRVERLVAAGNGLNDVALLRRADHRIVMPGSPRELLDLATEISDPLDEGGLTRSMTRLLLDQRR